MERRTESERDGKRELEMRGVERAAGRERDVDGERGSETVRERWR